MFKKKKRPKSDILPSVLCFMFTCQKRMLKWFSISLCGTLQSVWTFDIKRKEKLAELIKTTRLYCVYSGLRATFICVDRLSRVNECNKFPVDTVHKEGVQNWVSLYVKLNYIHFYVKWMQFMSEYAVWQEIITAPGMWNKLSSFDIRLSKGAIQPNRCFTEGEEIAVIVIN